MYLGGNRFWVPLIFFNRASSGCYAILMSYNNSETAVYGYNRALF